MKDIAENNKLIAEFMGLPECDRCYQEPCGRYKIGVGIYEHPEEMSYHKLWDWLMPVYLKIVNEELFGNNDEAIAIFNCMYDRLGDGGGIDEVYAYIIKFIKWYNQNN